MFGTQDMVRWYTRFIETVKVVQLLKRLRSPDLNKLFSTQGTDTTNGTRDIVSGKKFISVQYICKGQVVHKIYRNCTVVQSLKKLRTPGELDKESKQEMYIKSDKIFDDIQTKMRRSCDGEDVISQNIDFNLIEW